MKQIHPELDVNGEFNHEVAILKYFPRHVHTYSLSRALKHPNIVLFMGVARDPSTSSMYIVQELVNGGSLSALLGNHANELVLEDRLQCSLFPSYHHDIPSDSFKKDGIRYHKGTGVYAHEGVFTSRSQG